MGTPKTFDGRPRIALEKTDASKKNFFSHDWADPTTWYSTSIRVVDEVATDSGDHTAYALAHNRVIDTCHGKLWGEDYLLSPAGNSFRVGVAVNGVPKVEQDPHYGTGGDFVVNYASGTVTFTSARDAADVVAVTYHYALDSVFFLRPDAGKRLEICFAEVQFSEDIIITDTVLFQAYGYVDIFAPHLVPGVPSGTKIPLGAPAVYKGMRDYQTEAVKSYPSYPAMGGNSWRGLDKGVLVMDWDYVAATQISSAAGMEIRLRLQHDTPFGGAYGTCSFYCTSEPE